MSNLTYENSYVNPHRLELAPTFKFDYMTFHLGFDISFGDGLRSLKLSIKDKVMLGNLNL